ncbi:MAG: sigma-70 factor domain-containing protein, partial [Bryobacteraceae bacterium]
MEAGKEKGFVLYDEVNDLLAEDFPSGREFEDLLTDLDSAGVEILEEPKLDFEKSKEEPEDFGDLELTPETGDKTNDPVRMYLREMGTVPLLTREGEIELAKRNERGQWAVRKALSRSALVIREIIQLGEDLQRGVTSVRDVLVLPEFVITDEDFTGQLNDLLAQIGEIEKYYKKSLQFRQKLQAVSRQMKPKQHRGLRYGLARNMVQISRIIRNIGFSTSVRRSLAGRLRCSVEELKPLEREIAKIQ